MNKALNKVRALLAAWRFGLAVRWAKENGCVLARSKELARVRALEDGIWHYTLHSGHLTRAFHAGHILRMRHADVIDALDSAVRL